jgi:hypothetical protein
MISFFRKIRHQLLSQNRITRYLAYALGEILLVTIGILIALQVNTWNEERKLRKEEGLLIQNLHEEFEQNLSKLDLVADRLSKTEKSLRIILGLIDSQPDQIREEMLDSLLIKSVMVSGRIPQSFVLEDMKNTGGLSKIRNSDLKNRLFEWERIYSDLESSHALGKQAFEEYMTYLILNGSVRNIDAANPNTGVIRSKLPVKNLHFLKETVFENHVDNCQVLANEHLLILQKTRELMVSILELTKQ